MKGDNAATACAWFIRMVTAIREGRVRDVREARAELTRLGVTVLVDLDSPIRSEQDAPHGG